MGKTSYINAYLENCRRYGQLKVTINDWKLRVRLRLTPQSITLDDLELNKFDYSENFARFTRFGRQQQVNE